MRWKWRKSYLQSEMARYAKNNFCFLAHLWMNETETTISPSYPPLIKSSIRLSLSATLHAKQSEIILLHADTLYVPTVKWTTEWLNLLACVYPTLSRQVGRERQAETTSIMKMFPFVHPWCYLLPGKKKKVFDFWCGYYMSPRTSRIASALRFRLMVQGQEEALF